MGWLRKITDLKIFAILQNLVIISLITVFISNCKTITDLRERATCPGVHKWYSDDKIAADKDHVGKVVICGDKPLVNLYLYINMYTYFFGDGRHNILLPVLSHNLWSFAAVWLIVAVFDWRHSRQHFIGR